MQELALIKTRRVAWRSVAEPKLGGPKEALVRPVIASRCDGDNLPIFNHVTTGLRAGIALHYFDPMVSELLGPSPYGKPFALGHECIAEVAACGEDVRDIRKGQLVIVPWSISCGHCPTCERGHTSNCTEVGETFVSGYGFGESMGPWGGAVCDLMRVPFADAMLVPVPTDIDPLKLASASDNMPDAWRAVAPVLEQFPGAPVLVIGGGARSIGLYAAGMAVGLGSSQVDYVDYDPERLRIAETLGAKVIEVKRGGAWFDRHAPRVRGPYLAAVEASSTAAGIRYALRSLAAGGTCTAIGFYFAKKTGLPLMQMYANSITLHVGISHPRRDLPSVIDLVKGGTFDPLLVATLVADWDDAPDAFMTRTTKVVVRRKGFGIGGLKGPGPDLGSL